MTPAMPDRAPPPASASASVRALAVLYGAAPVLVDERHVLRDVLGPLMARAQSADFALARLRLAGIDLRPRELGALARCRVLVERLEGVTGGEELVGSPAAVRRRLRLLQAFLESGHVEVRVSAARCWTPDFSILHRVRRSDGVVVDGVAAFGAHYFARPYPVSGPALTCVTSDGDAVRLASERFDELWAAAYDVAFVLAERLRRLIGGTGDAGTVVRERPALYEASPASVARLALEARFGGAPAEAECRARIFDLAAFQKDAVARAELALARHGGVLLADGVGLGKTFLGLALAEAELRRGGRVLALGPAALARDWMTPLRRLAGACGMRLDGQRTAGAASALVWMSHTRLSRAGVAEGGRGGNAFSPTLVVVDEAHAFRNPATRRYRALAELCRRARVVLLTATPVNNRLSDLYFQLRLFAGDGAFTALGVADLREAFDTAAEAGDPAAILPVLRQVVIRRTRPFLRDHYGAVALPGAAEPVRFPRRRPPRPVRYALDEALPGGVAGVAGLLEKLTLAPYRLPEYGAAACGVNAAAAELLRFSLLKRLESSPAAFQRSVAALLHYEESFARSLQEGRLIRPKERALVASDQLVLGAVALDALPELLERGRLSADVATDLEILRSLARVPGATSDPKLTRLRQLLDELGEKVVVFTEFRDTALQLARGLAPLRVGAIHGGGAWLGGAPIGRRQLIERFAPLSNGAAPPPDRERVDVLIATDVLSEGLNLQDARIVISYDLPWNPVRLMQRIGRVDRLGSRHQEVVPLHFVPENGLEELLGLLRRIRAKLGLIRRTVPGDGDVVHGVADPAGDDALARILGGDSGALERAERAEAAPLEAEDRLRRLWSAIGPEGAQQEGDRPGSGAEASSISVRRDTAAPATASLVVPSIPCDRLLLCFDGPAPTWLVWDASSPDARDDDLAAAEIVAAALEGARTIPLDVALLAAGEEAGRRTLRARTAAASPMPRGGVAMATRLLLRALAAARHRPDPAACARADLLLHRLGRGVDAGTELALRRAARDQREDGVAGLIERLETVLSEAGGRDRRGALTAEVSAEAEAAPVAGYAGQPEAREEESGGEGTLEADPWGVSWRLRAVLVARPAAPVATNGPLSAPPAATPAALSSPTSAPAPRCA